MVPIYGRPNQHIASPKLPGVSHQTMLTARNCKPREGCHILSHFLIHQPFSFSFDIIIYPTPPTYCNIQDRYCYYKPPVQVLDNKCTEIFDWTKQTLMKLREINAHYSSSVLYHPYWSPFTDKKSCSYSMISFEYRKNWNAHETSENVKIYSNMTITNLKYVTRAWSFQKHFSSDANSHDTRLFSFQCIVSANVWQTHTKKKRQVNERVQNKTTAKTTKNSTSSLCPYGNRARWGLANETEKILRLKNFFFSEPLLMTENKDWRQHLQQSTTDIYIYIFQYIIIYIYI